MTSSHHVLIAKKKKEEVVTTMFLIFVFFLLSAQANSYNYPISSPTRPTVCIIGSGIGGSSVAHFLRLYSAENPDEYDNGPNFTIRMFERNGVVGGRMATVNIAGDTVEVGASILNSKNFHAGNYTSLLNLTLVPSSSSSSSFGIWNGIKFIFNSLSSDSNFLERRYGSSLIEEDSFETSVVDKFLKYYESLETRPIFQTVDDMLKWAGLYNLTARTLESELAEAGVSLLMIQELVTVSTRANYGQSASISGFAGAVSLIGGSLSVKGGNWQMAAGLISQSNVALHLHEEIKSISYKEKYYKLHSSYGKSYTCQVTVIATPLDELNLKFDPPITIPKRKLQHTYATFVNGLLNPAYFGMNATSEIPGFVGTIETPDLPFSSISVLKQHEKNITYKIFSRKAVDDALLDSVFSLRRETIRIDWAAYPYYSAPEVFAPFILDGRHLYYVNAFENAASAMETSAVAAENIARLILSRLFN